MAGSVRRDGHTLGVGGRVAAVDQAAGSGVVDRDRQARGGAARAVRGGHGVAGRGGHGRGSSSDCPRTRAQGKACGQCGGHRVGIHSTSHVAGGVRGDRKAHGVDRGVRGVSQDAWGHHRGGNRRSTMPSTGREQRHQETGGEMEQGARGSSGGHGRPREETPESGPRSTGPRHAFQKRPGPPPAMGIQPGNPLVAQVQTAQRRANSPSSAFRASLPPLFLQLIEQHGRQLMVGHRQDLAILAANHQFRHDHPHILWR